MLTYNRREGKGREGRGGEGRGGGGNCPIHCKINCILFFSVISILLKLPIDAL